MPKRRAKGEGTIYQRADGRWSGQITLPNGKRRTKYGKTQGEVRDWLTAQRGSIRTGAWSADTGTRLDEFLRNYLHDVVANQVRAGTMENYTRVAEIHLIPAFGNMRLTDLRPEHLQRLYTEKVAAGLAPGSVLIIHNVIHQTLKQAEEWGIVPRNVAGLVHPPHRRAAVPTILSIEQLDLVLTHTKNSQRGRWLYVAIYLAVSTGLRRGEILGLRWADIDFDQRSLRVARIASQLASREMVVAEPKTKSSRRLLTLDDATITVLREHRAKTPGDVVFPTPEGSYRDPDTLYEGWSRALKAVGVPHVKFHALRHMHATLLLEQSISPKVVSERLGHANVAITLQTYSHVSSKLEHAAANAIGQAMQGLQKD